MIRQSCKGVKMNDLTRLTQIMAQLRDPDGGCPWDLEQDFTTIAPYTIEEAYEVADAIERNDMEGLKGELGDLLLQVVFHAQMAKEAGAFTIEDVIQSVCDKMVSRHPHVFCDADISDAEAQTRNWETLKAAERKARGQTGLLDDVPLALPALLRSLKLTRRAARVGFDWPNVDSAIEKLHEELDEVRNAQTPAQKHEEIGDLLSCVVNIARILEVDPEAAMRGANAKFVRRFGHIEKRLAESGRTFEVATLEEMEHYWNEQRHADKAQGQTDPV
jgi:nucleoside triphosphate diphosphatase